MLECGAFKFQGAPVAGKAGMHKYDAYRRKEKLWLKTQTSFVTKPVFRKGTDANPPPSPHTLLSPSHPLQLPRIAGLWVCLSFWLVECGRVVSFRFWHEPPADDLYPLYLGTSLVSADLQQCRNGGTGVGTCSSYPSRGHRRRRKNELHSGGAKPWLEYENLSCLR